MGPQVHSHGRARRDATQGSGRWSRPWPGGSSVQKVTDVCLWCANDGRNAKLRQFWHGQSAGGPDQNRAEWTFGGGPAACHADGWRSLSP